MRILILCTGNSCRSQMAEGFLKSFDKKIEVVSAGTEPSSEVHPLAIKTMLEEGINLRECKAKSVNKFLNETFDYVITVCGGAKDSCPIFLGKVKQHLHIGFDDPAEAEGSHEFILSEFRRIRNEIKQGFGLFYKETLKSPN